MSTLTVEKLELELKKWGYQKTLTLTLTLTLERDRCKCHVPSIMETQHGLLSRAQRADRLLTNTWPQSLIAYAML